MKKNIFILFTLFFFYGTFAQEADTSESEILSEVLEDDIIDSESLTEITTEERKLFDIPHRVFEIGSNFNYGVSNNYFSTSECLKKELEVDLRKMADEIGENGLIFDTSMATDLFMNLNLKNGYHAGLSTGIECSGRGVISKELFEFLGYGNSLNEDISFSTDLDADVFAFAKTDFAFFIKDFRVSLGPSVFLPLFHVETEECKSHFINNSDGSIDAAFSTTLKINSFLPFDPALSDDLSLNSDNVTLGFDLDLAVDHQIFKTLMGRAYMRLPIVPGSMNNLSYTTVTVSYESDGIIDMLTGEENELKTDTDEMSYEKKKYWISRPFRTGAEVAWRPFGKYVKFGSLLGFGVKYPWTNKATAYIEYSFSADASLFNIIGLNFSSSYLNEIFIHQVGFMLNFRAVELIAGVSAQGTTFSKSFLGSGAGVYAGFRIGW